MRKQTGIMMLVFLTILFMLSGCVGLESKVKPEAKTDTGEEMLLPPYNGPKARVALGKFQWKVGGSGYRTKVSMGGQESMTITTERDYMTGLEDMLTTALVQSKRYRMLERVDLDVVKSEQNLTKQGYTDKSGKKKGGFKGADLVVVAAITGWEPGTSGTSGGGFGGLFGTAGAIFAGAAGAVKKGSMAMDIRIIDTDTGEILSATRVKGESKSINIGAGLAALTGGGGMGGGLGSFAKTPMEAAIRTCIYNAVKFTVENTPQKYFKY